jgi:hypothetical protein
MGGQRAHRNQEDNLGDHNTSNFAIRLDYVIGTHIYKMGIHKRELRKYFNYILIIEW